MTKKRIRYLRAIISQNSLARHSAENTKTDDRFELYGGKASGAYVYTYEEIQQALAWVRLKGTP